MAADAIVVEGLSKLFPAVQSGWRAFVAPFTRLTQPALSDVTFRVKTGELFAIIGANGAGKSTLLRILTTLLLPNSGRAFVCGRDVVRDPQHAQGSIGFHSGAEAGFYARMTARQNLRFFARLRSLDPGKIGRRIQEVSENLGLSLALDRQIRALSSGTIQRLSLARAVLHAPPVLLLDEPTRSLDPLGAASFRGFLRRELVEKCGTTVLFASHTLSEVEALGSQVAFLDAGRLLFCGTPRAMCQAASAENLEEAMGRLTRQSAIDLESRI